MKWTLPIFVVALILTSLVVGFVFGVSRPSASTKPVEIEVIDSKVNSQGGTTAIRRYGHYGGGLLNTISQVEIVLKQARQECVAYSREVRGLGIPAYEWSSENSLIIKDNMDPHGVALIGRCFDVTTHVTELNEYKNN